MIAAAIADRDEIGRLLPHGGTMVLLDEVISNRETEILCRTRSHGDPDNPLRGDAGLGPACGIEYGAQAMALHGALNGGSAARPGVLASVRKLNWSVGRLDDLRGDLMVRATVMIADGDRSIYRFALEFEGREVVTGQASVFLL